MCSSDLMAPEIASGRSQHATTAADIYSLGAILYELLTGVPPFQAPTAVEIWRRAVEEEPKNPTAMNRAVDLDLATICLHCLEKDPARRYASAQALADDLDHWLAGEPITARPVAFGERLWRWHSWILRQLFACNLNILSKKNPLGPGKRLLHLPFLSDRA